jgi:phenylpropionate dioxygenase-like ring-hydroxylating dioxygenase large terminal subunit
MSTEPAVTPGADDAPVFLRDLWYMAALSHTVGKGRMRRQMLLGEPVLIGRMRDGRAFALRDICPHRGVPLSAGRVTTENNVECPYHGWRFKADGGCTAIPSLVEGQDLEPSKIRVRAYPVREQDGLIWVYFAANEREEPKNEPPRVPIPNAKPRWVESQTFTCGIDHAVIGLMDPAHAPYVHGRWWWRVSPRVKAKHYEPLPTGFVMTRHAPSKAAYKILGGANVSTEITFELPSTRFENIRGTIFGREVDVSGLTVCTPHRREQHASHPDLLLARMAGSPQTVLHDPRSHIPGRRPASGGTAETGTRLQSNPDAHPGFRRARDVVPPPQEGLGRIDGERHAFREPRQGTHAALAQLKRACEFVVLSAPERLVITLNRSRLLCLAVARHLPRKRGRKENERHQSLSSPARGGASVLAVKHFWARSAARTGPER